jgi:hypothetical protein
MAIANYIVIGVFTALLGLVFWVLKYQISCQREEIKWLRERTESQELKIQHIESVLWDEEKLKNVIRETVKAVMNEILVAWYEKGKIGK